jgi:hypothetical protein
LQTITEILLGRPTQVTCERCKSTYNNETWHDFMAKKLKQFDIGERDKDLIIKIKMTLNRDARVEFVHSAKYYNPNEPRNLFKGTEAEANLSIEKILEKKTDDWLSLNWINAYKYYLVAVRDLIYLKYF